MTAYDKLREGVPALSVIVAIASDTTDPRVDVRHLTQCLEALRQQRDVPPFETIVPFLTGTMDPGELAGQFPEVLFLPVADNANRAGRWGSREHHDRLRASGVSEARGEIVAMLEDHSRPDERWCARIVQAHRQPYAAIGGAIENDVEMPLNWAVYFCDFGRYQNPIPAGESSCASDVNVAYKRSALERIRPIWSHSFNETTVNDALMAGGDRIALSPTIVVYQRRVGLTVGNALKERAVWGRSYAAARSAHWRPIKRAIYAMATPALPALLVLRMSQDVLRKRRNDGVFFRVLPLVTLLTMSWALGELTGYLTSLSAGEPTQPVEAAEGVPRTIQTSPR